MSDKKTLYERLVANAKATIDQLKAPFIKNGIDRKFKSAVDDANIKIIDLSKVYLDELQKIGDMDINVIIDAKSKIKKYNEAIVVIKESYIELFDIEMDK